MFPPLSSDNWTTIAVAFLAFGSAYFTARYAAKKSGTDTLTRVQLENAGLKVRLKELEDLLQKERQKTAHEMKERIEAEVARQYAEKGLESTKRVRRRKRQD